MSARPDFLKAMEGEADAPLWARAALAALAPAGWVYGAAMSARRGLFGAGVLRSEDSPCPVISVGNLALGGTGKTPAVAWAIERLIGAGVRPGVVSRGYGGEVDGITVVSDGGGETLASPPAADEAVMLARMFPTVPVVTGRNRPAAARRAAELGAEAVVSDDGFQHLALRRSLDIVLLRGDHPFGNGRVFPAGALREPAAALRRADAVLIMGDPAPGAKERAASLAPGAKVFEGRLRPAALLDLDGRPAGSPEDLSGASVVAVSGIGHPEGFARTLSGLGARIAEHLAYPDHAAYGKRDAERILAAIGRAGADLAVTTEKDAVKLSSLLEDERVRVLRAGLEIREGDELARLILEAAG